jgi:nucleotide-binding universal stress UspA family protein
MFHHILIPTDGSPLSAAAVENGISLARTLGAKVTVFTAIEPFLPALLSAQYVPDAPAQYRSLANAEADSRLADAEQKAKRVGVLCETVKVEHAQPYQAIIETADARGCDLITMASHGRRGLSALVLGSETMKVLMHSKLPVLVYR